MREKKKYKTHFKVLTDRKEIIREVRKRHLRPVRVKGTDMVVLVDMDDYYDNSTPHKWKFEPITWFEFFKYIDKHSLIIVQDTKSKFIKIITPNTYIKFEKYFENPIPKEYGFNIYQHFF